jgi:hypothetical protein
MRKMLCTALFLLIFVGLSWGQTPLTEIYLDNFRMVPGFGSPTVLDDFELGTNNWWDPDGSGSTYGTFYDEGEDWSTNSTTFSKDSLTVYDGLYSARLAYQWEDPDSAGFIREYPGSGDPQTYSFSTMDKLEVWLYGNASGDMIRFCIDDSDGHEVSEWITIDWDGWQLISWDLAADSVIAWVGGDGVATGPNADFDSFQILKGEATAVEPMAHEPELPTGYALSQNYPNPFNAETRIRFAVPEAGHVSLKVYNVTGQLVRELVDETMPAGSHSAVWNGRDEAGRELASGVYFCRMVAGSYAESIKMTFLR